MELAFVGEASLGAPVEVVGYLDFHAVGYLLVFFQTRVEPGEFLALFLCVDKLLGHVDHTLHALGIYREFFLCLGDIEFRGAEQTSGDELELEFLVLLVLCRHELLHDFHIKAREPYHDKYVDEVEYGVEHRQAERYAELHFGDLHKHRVLGRE